MRKLCLTLFSLAAATAAWAIPAKPGLLLTTTQPDGTTLSFYQRGDESVIDDVTADGYRIARDADGAYRYAAVTPEGLVAPIAGAPLAHDAQLRQAAETVFVQTLVKADLQDVVVRSNSPLLRSPQSRATFDGTEFPDMKKGTFPDTGEQPCLVILVEYSNDWEFSFTKEEISDMLNKEGYSDNNFTGSARDFFTDNSMGRFTPRFDVVGPVKLSKPYFYYGKDTMGYRDQHAGDMIGDACQLAHDELGVDFSNYDIDQDGWVDMVYVIYVKYGQNLSGDNNQIWPHKGYLRDTWGINKQLDGKGINVYACSAELYGGSGFMSAGIGALCHEFSHVLGLADHYNQENSYAYETGSHDIMCTGPYNNRCLTPPNYSAMERMTLGWLEPEVLDRPVEGVELGNLADTNKAYAIPTDDPNDFFMLESRSKTGWDAYLADEGMMITRVSYVQGDWENNQPNRVSHKGYTLMFADDRASDGSEDQDFWPNGTNRDFTSASSPAMKKADGTVVEGKGVYGISYAATSRMSKFTFAEGIYSPHSLQVELLDGENGVELSWKGSSKATSYKAYMLGTESNGAESNALQEVDTDKCKAQFLDLPADVVRFFVVAVTPEGESEPSHEIMFDNTNIGIGGIGADANATAAYYDLMGRKVDNPRGGVFVKVLNGKAVKVVK